MLTSNVRIETSRLSLGSGRTYAHVKLRLFTTRQNGRIEGMRSKTLMQAYSGICMWSSGQDRMLFGEKRPEGCFERQNRRKSRRSQGYAMYIVLGSIVLSVDTVRSPMVNCRPFWRKKSKGFESIFFLLSFFFFLSCGNTYFSLFFLPLMLGNSWMKFLFIFRNCSIKFKLNFNVPFVSLCFPF